LLRAGRFASENSAIPDREFQAKSISPDFGAWLIRQTDNPLNPVRFSVLKFQSVYPA
jgi:hypothetical protein